MSFLIPVTDNGEVEPRFGRAPKVAVAEVADGKITDWQVHEVHWDIAHDAGTEGSHHARIVRFLKEHSITDVVVDHMGAPMQNTVTKLGIRIHRAASPNAKESVNIAAKR